MAIKLQFRSTIHHNYRGIPTLKHFLFRPIVFVFLLILLVFQSDPRHTVSAALLQVHVIARHGQRSPCNRVPPSLADPYKHYWTRGLGQLTEHGAAQHRELGDFLRRTYLQPAGGLFSLPFPVPGVPHRFHRRLVRVRSTDMERTIQSALACMTGLFPPVNATSSGGGGGDDIINRLIPVHTVPKRYDVEMKMSGGPRCPRHEQLLQREFEEEAARIFHLSSSNSQSEQPEMRGVRAVLNALRDVVVTEEAKKSSGTQRGGGQRLDLERMMRVCDPVLVWRELGLAAPDWASGPEMERGCRTLTHLKFVMSYQREPRLNWFRGGPLVRLVRDQMGRRLNAHRAGPHLTRRILLEHEKVPENASEHRLVGMFTHDSTLAAFMSNLRVFNGLKPPLASAIIVELHSAPPRPSSASTSASHSELDDAIVRILFRNDSQRAPHLLEMPECANPCRFVRFSQLVERSTPANHRVRMQACHHGAGQQQPQQHEQHDSNQQDGGDRAALHHHNLGERRGGDGDTLEMLTANYCNNQSTHLHLIGLQLFLIAFLLIGCWRLWRANR